MSFDTGSTNLQTFPSELTHLLELSLLALHQGLSMDRASKPMFKFSLGREK